MNFTKCILGPRAFLAMKKNMLKILLEYIVNWRA